MRKIIKVLLVTAVLLAMTALTVSAIDTSHWAIDYVDFCLNNMIIDGYRSSFPVNEEIPRKRVALAIVRIEEALYTNYETSPFDDVYYGDNYTGPINWVYSEGIMNGHSDGLFHPDDPIRRQDMALVIHRYLTDCCGIDLPVDTRKTITAFGDYDQIDSYAADAVEALYDAGIITGADNSQFRPQDEVTFAEAACFFTRAHGYRYREADAINVYLKYESGLEVNNGVVAFLRQGSTSSLYNEKEMQIKMTSYGFASLLSSEMNLYGANNTASYYANGMSQYTSTFSMSALPQSPMYVFLTLPGNIADYDLSESYNRTECWGHNYVRDDVTYPCEEYQWAFSQGCPTALMHSGQNFGWRYNGGVEFHQGMDYGCVTESIYNTTGYQMMVVSCGNDVYGYNEDTNTYDELGYYVKVRLLGTDKYLIFQHLHGYSVTVGQIINVNSTGVIAVTGDSGAGGYHLHLTMTDKAGDVYYPMSSPYVGKESFYDPRIYFK